MQHEYEENRCSIRSTVISIEGSFANYKSVFKYCTIVRKVEVVRDGLERAYISMTMNTRRIWNNSTGCYR